MNQTVSLLTKDATLDDLSMSDYRDIFNELREKMSLDKLVGLLESQYSKAQWSKFEHSLDMILTRMMRNELRVGVGLPPLPPTIEQAVRRQASPDASVWKVGEGTPEHVIMVGSVPVALFVNLGVTVMEPLAHVTNVTPGQNQREYTARPYVSKTQKERFLALPVRSWAEVIEAGLETLEGKIKP